MRRVKDLRELKKLCRGEDGEDFFISFGMARSSKHISYDGTFWYIFNEIDDSEQTLTTRELKQSTSIIEALEKGALYMYD